MTREELESVARKAAERHGVDPEIYVRQINQESGFNPRAVSGAGAQGIAQFMRPTADEMGLQDPFDPVPALDAGARYLKKQLDTFEGNYEKALGAYNAGARNIRRGIWPKETRDYVGKILGGFTNPGSALGTLYSPAARGPQRSTSETLGAGMFGRAMGRREAAADDLRTVMGEQAPPLNLPRTPVRDERSMLGAGIPSLFANLATAISGNPLYQQAQMGRMIQEDEERRGAMAENRALSRQELMENRAATLQMLIEKRQMAARRLEQAEQHELATEQWMESAKLQEKLQKMQDDAAAARAKEAADATRYSADQRTLAAITKAGYRLKTNPDGTTELEETGEKSITFTRDDRLKAQAEFQRLAQDAKADPAMRGNAHQAMIRTMITPDDNDKTWQGFASRVAGELRGMDPLELRRIMMLAAYENAGKLPGAQEAYEAFQRAAGVDPATIAAMRQQAADYGAGYGEPGPEDAGAQVRPKEGAKEPRRKGALEAGAQVLDAVTGPIFRGPSEEEAAARRGEIGEALGGAAKTVVGAVGGSLKVGAAVGKIGREGIRQGAQAFTEATTMTPVEIANKNIEAAQRDVDNLEGLMRKYPTVFAGPDTISQVAQAYKRLAKAKKDLETIQTKGEGVKKTR